MKRLFILILSSLFFCSQSFSNEIASSSAGSSDQVRGMTFQSKDFKDILLDLAIIGGIIIAGKKLPKDKKLHFYAGALTGLVVGEWCKRSSKASSTTNPKRRNFMCSLGAATAVGVLKEVYDSTGRGNVEFKDALITAAGGAAVGITFLN